MTAILDTAPFPWHLPQARELRDLLTQLFPNGDAARNVAVEAGIPAGSVHWDQAGSQVWHELLDAAATSGKARAVVERAVALEPEFPRRPFFEALLREQPLAPPGSGAESDEPRRLWQLRYFERLEDALGNLSPAIPPRVNADGSFPRQQWPLSEVFVPLELHRARDRSDGEIDWGRLIKTDRVVLTGAAGAGKSTLLRHLVLTVVGCRRTRLNEAGAGPGREDGPLDPLCRIPVWINLPDAVIRLKQARGQVPGPRWYRNLSEDDWLEPVASAVRLSRDEARALLEEGEVLLVFDGLDEIADADARLALAEVISRLPNAFGGLGTKNPVVITCREKAWGRGGGFAPFERIQIQPMDSATWKRYFDRWCRAVWAEDAERVLHNLRASLRTSRAVQELAQNPQTATMLAVLAREGELPQQRVRLYDEFLSFALANDRMERYGGADQVRGHLAALAVELQHGATPAGEVDGLSETEARSLLGARLQTPGGPERSEEEVRRAGELLLADLELHTGLVSIHRPEGPMSARALVSFRHRTMLEFLVACDYASRPEEILPFEGETTWLVPIVLVSGLLAKDGRDDRLEAFLRALANPGAAGPNRSPADLEKWGQRLAVLRACLDELASWQVPPQTLAPAREAHENIGRVLQEFDLPSRVAIVDGMGILGDPRLRPAQASRWVEIQACSSWFGSDSDEAWIQESPRRTVNLSSYAIQRWPVTVEEFARFVEGARGYKDDRWWDEAGRLWRDDGRVEAPDGWEQQRAGSNRPITGVSWWEARAFARWLTSIETFPARWAITLPTEAQWERAARGPFGSAVHEAGRFPWGAEWDPLNLRANCGRVLDRVCPVGIFPLGNSPEDIWDLAGNVGERCLDGFGAPESGDMKPAAQDGRDPCHFDHRFGHTVRGGDWASPVLNARVSARLPDSQSARSGRIGFRCVAWQAPHHLR